MCPVSLTTDSGKNKMGLRGDAIAQFDWCVGQLVKTLEDMKILDNTIIIISSDKRDLY